METIISPYLNNNNSIIALFLLLLFSYLLLKKTKGSKRRAPPAAGGGWPIVGHLPLLGGPKLPHETLGAMADKYGPIFTIRVGVHQTLVISSSEAAKECYTTLDSAVSSRPTSVGGKLLGYNFAGFGFRAYDSFYRTMRKIIASELLSNRRLELQRDIRVSEVKRSVRELHDLWTKREEFAFADHVLVDMDWWIGSVNLKVILRMVCGKRFLGGGEMKRCRKAMREFFDLAGQFMVGDAVPFLSWLDLGGYQKAMKRVAKELDCTMEEWLQEHRRKRDAGGGAAEGERDFMDVMLSTLEGIDLAGYDVDTVNKATCMTMISGGTDTTSETVSWAISLLLNNREALKRAQEELDTHVGNTRLVEESDISKLEYLQAIVKETLRLYPAGPLSGIREFSNDCTVGGYDVAAGTRLITNLWKIQTDPRVWGDEPLEFRPERFLGSHRHLDVRDHNFEFAPFGCGRRVCPGLGLGVQMTQLVLASLIHSVELETRFGEPVDMAAEFGLTIHRVTPLQVLVKPRLLATAYA